MHHHHHHHLINQLIYLVAEKAAYSFNKRLTDRNQDNVHTPHVVVCHLTGTKLRTPHALSYVARADG